MNAAQEQSLRSLVSVLKRGKNDSSARTLRYEFNEKEEKSIIMKIKRFDKANPGFLDHKDGKAFKLNMILRYELGFLSNDDIYNLAAKAF